MAMLVETSFDNVKQGDIQPCIACSKPFMHSGAIQFYKLRVGSFIVNLDAARRQHGLEMMLGSPRVAQVMGPDDDMAVAVCAHDVCVCQTCALETSFGMILQRIADENTGD